MLNETYEINDEFNDDLDYINDQLTVYCEKTFTDFGMVVSYVEMADSLLRTKGLNLDFSDVESIRINLEDPSEQEAINFVIPVYKGDEQSEFNLVVTYYQDTDDSEFEIEMELQYVWETDSDDEDDEFEDLE
jgi:hypothetical protein